MGSPEKPLLLCLPGALLNDHQFDLQRAQLSTEIAVEAFDYHHLLVGDENDQGIVRTANAIGVHLGGKSDRRTFLCGHSLGGMIAQQVAAGWGDRLDGLILIETSYGPFPRWAHHAIAALSRAAIRLTPWPMMRKAVVRHHGQYSAAANDYLRNALSLKAPKNWRSVIEQALSYNGREILPAIKVPTVIITGAMNNATKNQASIMADEIPTALKIEVQDAGHLVNLDNPVLVNTIIRDVCSSA